MTLHTLQVIIGQTEPQQLSSAQPIGPKDGLSFVVPLLCYSVCVGVIFSIIGAPLGMLLGLKSKRKAIRFAGPKSQVPVSSVVLERDIPNDWCSTVFGQPRSPSWSTIACQWPSSSASSADQSGSGRPDGRR